MNENMYVDSLRKMQKFFNNTIEVLTEEDSSFRATPETRTVSEQVAHTAQTVKWFSDATFTDKGFEGDYEKMEKEVQTYTSLAKAKEWFDSSVDEFCNYIEAAGEDEMMKTLPENPLFGKAPKLLMVNFTVEHTSHHRGSLAVYARLLGKAPKMPYME